MKNQLRVLLIDADLTHRNQVTQMLNFETGIKIVSVMTDGVQAISIANQLQPDVVLVERTLPDFDGFEVAQEISRKLPATAVILMSEQILSRDLQRARRAGAKEFLVKPFTQAELLGAIKQVAKGN
jgi:pilus assembly protein CpaE